MGQSCVNTARWRTVKEMEVGKFNNQEHLHKHETERNGERGSLDRSKQKVLRTKENNQFALSNKTLKKKGSNYGCLELSAVIKK